MASKSRRAQIDLGEDEIPKRQRKVKAPRQQRATQTREEPRVILEPVRGKTDRQNDYIAALRSDTCIFGIGPAGTGKTYCSVSVAAELLAAGSVERIILTRPAVEAGERLGFMPGDLEEKYGHFIRPLRDVLDAKFGRGYVAAALRSKKIEPVPLAFMRGMSIDNTFILADEMQNATRLQTKMLLSRVGEWTRISVDGDPSQIDLPDVRQSGLMDAVGRMQGRAGVAVVRFTHADIVRSGFAREVIDAYENQEPRRSLILPAETDEAGLLRALGA